MKCLCSFSICIYLNSNVNEGIAENINDFINGTVFIKRCGLLMHMYMSFKSSL